MQDKTMPLRFHKFVWYVWMPFSLLGAISTAYTRLSDYLTAYTPFEYGGLLLLIFLLYSLFEALFVAAPIAIFVGFFRWKKYAWYILMILSVSNIICSPLLLVLNSQTYDAATLLGRMLGIAFDVFVVYYYWMRRQLFNIPAVKSKAADVPTAASAALVCRKCSRSLPAGNKFCPFCGTPLNAPPSYCKECGLKLPLNCKFCPSCGTQVSD